MSWNCSSERPWPRSRIKTPAGLPANGTEVNASMTAKLKGLPGMMVYLEVRR